MTISNAILRNQEYIRHSRKIDAIIARIEKFKESVLDSEIIKRKNTAPDFDCSDNAVIKRLVHIIAYSQQAKAKRVTALIKSNAFDNIFRKYDIDSICSLNPKDYRLVQRLSVPRMPAL